ncbi:hypothetical protein I553_3000 [Mycobacterium xenopi 4042]|uniref:Uncharacterized protein n=1 Tax=Mycobacterium xenopi 4042 TaxID=1299334 RepID=X8EDQ0_MYCXE|nr:hypothetical protein I553_3000 [Mycobacterium xenopi 4042]
MAARCGLRRRKAVIGTRLRGCVPCATTIGSLPSVSTSSQSWPCQRLYGGRHDYRPIELV